MYGAAPSPVNIGNSVKTLEKVAPRIRQPRQRVRAPAERTDDMFEARHCIKRRIKYAGVRLQSRVVYSCYCLQGFKVRQRVPFR